MIRLTARRSRWVNSTSLLIADEGWPSVNSADQSCKDITGIIESIRASRNMDAATAIALGVTPLVSLYEDIVPTLVVAHGAYAEDAVKLSRWGVHDPLQSLASSSAPSKCATVALEFGSPMPAPPGYGWFGRVVRGIVTSNIQQTAHLLLMLTEKYGKLDLPPGAARVAAMVMTAAQVSRSGGLCLCNPKELQHHVLTKLANGARIARPSMRSQQPPAMSHPDSMEVAAAKLCNDVVPLTYVLSDDSPDLLRAPGQTGRPVPAAVAIESTDEIMVSITYLSKWCKWNLVDRDALIEYIEKRGHSAPTHRKFDFGAPVGSPSNKQRFVKARWSDVKRAAL